MMRRKIQRMARGYQSKRKLVFCWDGPYDPMSDMRALVHAWMGDVIADARTWDDPTITTPLAEMRRIQTLFRERGTSI